MIREKMRKMIEREINCLKDEPVVLFLINSNYHLEIKIAILKQLVREDTSGIYVTLNRPYVSLIDMLQKGKINTNRIFFIDCITKAVGQEEEAKNVLYAESPQNLTKLCLTIEEAGKALPSRKKFLVLDARTTRTIYNSAGTVSKFLHFLTNKVRLLGLDGIFLSIEKELDTEIEEQLRQFVDRVIDLSG